jgi:hypothetical protein
MEVLIEAVLWRVYIALKRRFELSVFAIFLCFTFRIVSPIYGQQMPQVSPTPMTQQTPQVSPAPMAQQTPQVSPTPSAIYHYEADQTDEATRKAIEEGVLVLKALKEKQADEATRKAIEEGVLKALKEKQTDEATRKAIEEGVFKALKEKQTDEATRKAVEEGVREAGVLEAFLKALDDLKRAPPLPIASTSSGVLKPRNYYAIPTSAPEYSKSNLSLAIDAVTFQKEYITALENQVKALQAEINALKEKLNQGGTPK